MPNWCEATLTVQGSKAELDRFRLFAKTKDKVLDEKKFLPYPKRFVDMDIASRLWDKKNTVDGTHFGKLKEGVKCDDRPKDGFNSGGYEWCIENWGTKWGICDPVLTDKSEDELHYRFDTAWSPCTPVIFKMSELFPALTFEMEYFEGGMGFSGYYCVKNGDVIKDATADYAGPRGG